MPVLGLTWEQLVTQVREQSVNADASDLAEFCVEVANLIFKARVENDYPGLAGLLSPAALSKVSAADTGSNITDDAPGGQVPTYLMSVDVEPLAMVTDPSRSSPIHVRLRVTYWGTTKLDRERHALWREAWTVVTPGFEPAQRANCDGCGAPLARTDVKCKYCGSRTSDNPRYVLESIKAT